MCSGGKISAREEKCCNASVILWWHGDIVEAAGRPSGYEMNYSIRDNIPPPLCLQGEVGGAGTTLQDVGLRTIPAEWHHHSSRVWVCVPAPEGTGTGLLTSCIPQKQRHARPVLCTRTPFSERIPANKCFFPLHLKRLLPDFLSKIHHCYCRCITVLILELINNHWDLFTLS